VDKALQYIGGLRMDSPHALGRADDGKKGGYASAAVAVTNHDPNQLGSFYATEQAPQPPPGFKSVPSASLTTARPRSRTTTKKTGSAWNGKAAVGAASKSSHVVHEKQEIGTATAFMAKEKVKERKKAVAAKNNNKGKKNNNNKDELRSLAFGGK